jgi:cyanocobalamin reductase (cyanide-eliminating) / alkylcobalamin dealkylase
VNRVIEVDEVAARCAIGGIDLSAVTSAGAYDALVDVPFRLGAPVDATVLVLGNTRALWPHLERFLRDHGPLDDPVDTYVIHTVHAATADVRDLLDIRFSHEPPPRRIAIQRLADRAGLAWLSPSHLCVHPTYGPWIALRAAIVLGRPLIDVPTAATARCECTTNCLPRLQEAIAAGEPSNNDEMVAQWHRWLAMRDACPVGREHRYSDEQIRYHYLGERPLGWPAASI